MYAIIATGGKQYRVAEGDVIRVESLAAELDAPVVFEEVLAVGQGAGLRVGTPRVEGAQVHARVLDHGRSKKVKVFYYRPKKRWSRQRGHRQGYTRVRIEKIEV